MTHCNVTPMPHIRTALRTCLEDRFEPGKELSDDEFEKLAVRLLEDEMTGKPDAGKILNEFLDRPEMNARRKVHHPSRYYPCRVQLGIFHSIREWLRTGEWETETVKYRRVNFGEPGYDEAPCDGTNIYCRDVLNLSC